ncbi:Fic/DOC family protein [Lactiplantibacillus daowaiensis]|uniref:protein adenylyltransferase n=1 Tax=Lactiplantibacillus daowaiensis TaxID=2559918 RepID=A0ABW1S1A9_9LACO|nr:Fic family protein [Lactiplantibacillus daowaiensis]
MDKTTAWQDYLQPNGTLKNLLSITDAELLAQVEYRTTMARQTYLAERDFQLENGLTITGHDFEEVLQLHAYLFDGIYEWAGQFRTVDMMKGGSSFLEAQFLPTALGEINRDLERYQIVAAGDLVTTAEVLGKLISDFNFMHPFREGNGRTQRTWAQGLAFYKGFWFEITPDQPAYDA